MRAAWMIPIVFWFLASPAHAAPISSPAADTGLASKEGEHKSYERQEASKAVSKAAAPVKKELTLADPDPADLKLKGIKKKLSGAVSGVGVSGMAVEHQFDPGTASAEEVWFNFSKAVKFLGYKKFTDIRFGDRVEVLYMEPKDNSKRVLMEVKLVSRAPKEPEPAPAAPEPEPEAEPAPEEGAAEADEAQ